MFLEVVMTAFVVANAHTDERRVYFIPGRCGAVWEEALKAVVAGDDIKSVLDVENAPTQPTLTMLMWAALLSYDATAPDHPPDSVVELTAHYSGETSDYTYEVMRQPPYNTLIEATLKTLEVGAIESFGAGESTEFLWRFVGSEAVTGCGLEGYLKVVKERPATDGIAERGSLIKHAQTFGGGVTAATVLSFYESVGCERVFRSLVTSGRECVGESEVEKKMVEKLEEDVRGVRRGVLALVGGGGAQVAVRLAEDLEMAVDCESGGVDASMFKLWLEVIAGIFGKCSGVVAGAGRARAALMGVMRKYAIPVAAATAVAKTLLIIGRVEEGFGSGVVVEECAGALRRWLEGGAGDWAVSGEEGVIKFKNPATFTVMLTSGLKAAEAVWAEGSDEVTRGKLEAVAAIEVVLRPAGEGTLTCELVERACKLRVCAAADKIMAGVKGRFESFDVGNAPPEWVERVANVIAGLKRWNKVEKRRWANSKDGASGEDVRKRLGGCVGKCEGVEGVVERRLRGLVAAKVKREKKAGKKKKGGVGGDIGGLEDGDGGEELIKVLGAFVKTAKSFEFADAVAVSGPFKKRAAGALGGGEGKRKKGKGVVRSRNQVVDDWLEEEGGAAGDDAYNDLEGWIVE